MNTTETPQPPASSQWEEYQTTYLPGDLVKTEFGEAIISEATCHHYGRESYSVWHLPGWKWRRESWGWIPKREAWYDLSELQLIEQGPASRRRPQINLAPLP